MHSVPHARSPPSLHYVGFIVKSQTITLSNTCQHAVRQEFFTSKTAYSAPSSADFAILSACLEGINGVERRQQAQFQAVAVRAELGTLPCTAGALGSLRATPRSQHQGKQVAREKVLESLCISLAAVEGVKPPVKPTKQ